MNMTLRQEKWIVLILVYIYNATPPRAKDNLFNKIKRNILCVLLNIITKGNKEKVDYALHRYIQKLHLSM